MQYGKALDISYLQYLWEAHTNILRCMRDCRVWSALYDGDSPDPDTFLRSLPEESPASSAYPGLRLPPQLPSKTGPQPAPRKDKSQTELEWDDSYDTGISPGAAVGSPRPYDDLENPGLPAPIDPPKHIQEMKRTAILRFKGSYIEESDFQDDVMVYRLCAEKDSEDTGKSQEEPASPLAQGQTEVQSTPTNNGPLPSPQPETDSEEEHHRDNSDMFPDVSEEPPREKEPEEAPEPNSELATPLSEAEHSSDPTAADPEGDFIARYDQIIKDLDSGSEGLMEQNFSSPDALLLTNEQEGKEESRGGREAEEGKEDLEEEDDFDAFIVEAPAEETVPSPFGVRDETDLASRHPMRTQSTPFTGDHLSLLCDFCF